MNEHEAHALRVAQIREVLPSLLRDGCGKTCLYVGATPWRFQLGQELHEAGYEITLLEIDPDNAYFYEGHPWLGGGVICGDVRELGRERRWDVAVWWHGPEHIARQDLGPAIRGLESVAGLVVLAAPWGINKQPVVEGNLHQEHKAHLQPVVFEQMGYRAVTCGVESDLSTWPHILAWKQARPERVIYTAVFGGYDELRPLRGDGFRACCFSDVALDVSGWECIVVERRMVDPRREARMYKALAHQWFPEAEASLWMDGNTELLVEPDDLFGYLDDESIAMPVHPSSRTLADEAALIVQLGKADQVEVERQLARYNGNVGPVGATTWMMRRHTAEIARLNEMWWSELTAYTLRDQLSLPWCLSRLGIEARLIDVPLYDNKLVRVHSHQEKAR